MDTAKRKLYAIVKNSMEVFQLLKNSNVEIESWMLSKLIKSDDYLESLRSHIAYDTECGAEGDVIPEPIDANPVDIEPHLPDEPIDAPMDEPMDFETDQETVLMSDTHEQPASNDWNREFMTDASEVLQMAHARKIISDEQLSDPEFPLWGIAQDIAEEIPADSDKGTSDWSYWLKNLVRNAHYANIPLDGPSAHLYENEHRARDILERMHYKYQKTK